MIANLRTLMGICIGLATLSLAAGCASANWIGTLVVLAIGLLWLSVLRHSNPRVADWGLFLLMAGAVWGGFEQVAWGWLLTGVAAALAAWDLTHYLDHLQAASERQAEDRLVRRHLLRLAGVTLGGWMLAALTLLVNIHFNYIGALVLAGAGVLALTRTLRTVQWDAP